MWFTRGSSRKRSEPWPEVACRRRRFIASTPMLTSRRSTIRSSLRSNSLTTCSPSQPDPGVVARKLFALDHNFPQPIVDVLTEYQEDAELVRVDGIDDRLPQLDDWALLLALHHHDRPWDGLITTDTSMLNRAREMAAVMQTKLTLVVAMEAGHNPVKASGLLFAYLGGYLPAHRARRCSGLAPLGGEPPPRRPVGSLPTNRRSPVSRRRCAVSRQQAHKWRACSQPPGGVRAAQA
jgi:hypothetical protein